MVYKVWVSAIVKISFQAFFCTTIYKEPRLKTGWRVRSYFEIGLNLRDEYLLQQLQDFFGGVGTLRIDIKNNAIKYSVSDFNHLTRVIIPHFKEYPLLTQKGADLLLFEQIVELMSNGAHLTDDGLKQIINIKASMNLGVSEVLKSNFNDIVPVYRPTIETERITDPNWLSGFVSGEGNFDAGIRKTENKLGFRPYLRFRVSQHARDNKLLELIINYLGVGRLEKNKNDTMTSLVVGQFTDLNSKIIPFFNEYPILGVKFLDYQDWSDIAKLISEGAHQTIEGMDKIRKIESGMNKGRKN